MWHKGLSEEISEMFSDLVVWDPREEGVHGFSIESFNSNERRDPAVHRARERSSYRLNHESRLQRTRERQAEPEVKAKLSAYWQRPENKERKAARERARRAAKKAATQ